MLTKDFFYEYPSELIAKHPLAKRDESRMMVLNRFENRFFHHSFLDFATFFNRGDLVIFNNTRVLPARLLAQKSTGGKVDILLIRPVEENRQVWECLIKPGVKKGGSVFFEIEGSKISAVVEEDQEKIKTLRFAPEVSVENLMRKIGSSPLPPYMGRKEIDPNDFERYQTIFAEKEGAIAAPTAGLHFTPQILDQLKQRGVEIHSITLHVGLGTFEPVRTEKIVDHRMHTEFYEVSPSVADAVLRAKKENRSVTAVGTTAVRALESYFADIFIPTEGEIPRAHLGNSNLCINENKIHPREMKTTNLFVSPGYSFKVIDRLFTNFHQPESTLIMLTSAFAGKEFLFESYREAIKEKYRLFSYGDCMLIL